MAGRISNETITALKVIPDKEGQTDKKQEKHKNTKSKLIQENNWNSFIWNHTLRK